MKQAAKRKPTAINYSKDGELHMALPERRRQMGGVVKVLHPLEPKSRTMVHQARCECKLDAYLFTGRIAQDEHEAGIKFRAAWRVAAHGIKTRDSTVERVGCGESDGALAQLITAKRILNAAYAELSPFQAMIIADVCGADNWAGDKQRVATMRRGLDRLARFWGLV